jgi:hypothetical protein
MLHDFGILLQATNGLAYSYSMCMIVRFHPLGRGASAGLNRLSGVAPLPASTSHCRNLSASFPAPFGTDHWALGDADGKPVNGEGLI